MYVWCVWCVCVCMRACARARVCVCKFINLYYIVSAPCCRKLLSIEKYNLSYGPKLLAANRCVV